MVSNRIIPLKAIVERGNHNRVHTKTQEILGEDKNPLGRRVIHSFIHKFWYRERFFWGSRKTQLFIWILCVPTLDNYVCMYSQFFHCERVMSHPSCSWVWSLLFVKCINQRRIWCGACAFMTACLECSLEIMWRDERNAPWSWEYLNLGPILNCRAIKW